jgi:hypothetical protein
MILVRALIVALALAACGEQKPAEGARAPVVSMAPQDASENAPAAAPDEAAFDAEILSWARSIYNIDGPNLIEPIDTFYGDFNGDGAPDGLAFAYFDIGGSGAGLDVSLFENRDGHMAHLRRVDEVLGQEPRGARFERGRIFVTTTVLGPGDPRCCPTKAHEWTIATN